MNCKICDAPLISKYCHECGESAHLKRIDNHYVSHEISHIFHFEKGFFYNLLELTIRPGDSIRKYIKEDRTKHMKPVGYLIITSLLYTLAAHYLHAPKITDGRIIRDSPTTNIIFNWVSTHYGYANILESVVTAFFVYLIFRKYKYNIYEIVVLVCFVLGQGMMIMILISSLHPFIHPFVYGILNSFTVFVYAAWAFAQFFNKNKVSSYLLAILAYFLGYLFFYVLCVAVGVSIDFFSGTLK